MLLLGLCRVGFYLFNVSYFPGMTVSNFMRLMWGGLRFDLTTMLYFNALFILFSILPFDFRFNVKYQGFLKYLFFVTNGLALAMNVSDFIYYRFTLRRTTADVFQQFENEQNMGALWLRFLIDYWYAVVFWILLIWLMVLLYRKTKVQGPQLSNRMLYYASGVVVIPLIAWLMVGGIRGGFRHSTRPITLSNAGDYVQEPRDVNIVLNTPFAVIRTFGKTKIQRLAYLPEDSLAAVFTPVHLTKDTTGFRPDNVVIIILESFSKEFFGVFNKDIDGGTYKGYTPFLDSLAQHSHTFQYSFANGRKSIDGLPSVVCSIPSLGIPYVLTPYSGNNVNSVASLLKSKGYGSSFFHGAPNGSMGFSAFTNLSGFDSYYGMTEYNNDDDFDGLWGIWDEKFLNFYADKLNGFQEPFVSAFFSVSSHHPFIVPEEHADKFKGGPEPIQKCIEYTDYSLRQFFKKVSVMPWYDHTLFVITADHTSSNVHYDQFKTPVGFYSVPIMYFKGDNSLAAFDTTITQQIDIMPSVMGYLHFDQNFVAFGRNVFGEARTPFAFNFKDNLYQLTMGDYLLQFDGARSVGLYNFKTDFMIKHNVVGTLPRVQQRMETFIKAFIQQYNNRLIDNKLVVTRQP